MPAYNKIYEKTAVLALKRKIIKRKEFFEACLYPTTVYPQILKGVKNTSAIPPACPQRCCVVFKGISNSPFEEGLEAISFG